MEQHAEQGGAALSRREALAWVARAAVAGCLMAHACGDALAEEAGGGKAPNVKDLTKIPGGAALASGGAIVVMTEKGLAAFADTCPHKGKALKVDGTKGIFCPAHGSGFGADGKVTKGPAKSGLSWLKLTVDKDGNISVDPKTPAKEGEWVAPRK
ncbi:MAG: Rieske (2Fe-2S) protein [Planctomycetota bacterium]|nr:Rieske (2Fe-2S) protein [Planctomycetota bacterium]